ncbi:MAG: hypothetical protein GY719_01010 [bacterium]|nr:hypothetical protein [bacterium]
MAEGKIRLAAVVQQLREELIEAMAAGEGEELRFDLDDVKVEVQAVVTREAQGKGGVKFWVLDAEVAGKIQDSRTQKITLSLKPRRGPGGKVTLGDER